MTQRFIEVTVELVRELGGEPVGTSSPNARCIVSFPTSSLIFMPLRGVFWNRVSAPERR